MKLGLKIVVLVLAVARFNQLSAQQFMNYVPYNQKGLWGYADTAGNIVVKPFSANELGFFDDSDYVKYYSANGMEGLMDKNFKIILPSRFLSLMVYDKKIIVAEVFKGSYKIFSFKGKQLSTLMFKEVSYCYNDEAFLLLFSTSGTAFLYTYDSKLDQLFLKRKHTGVSAAHIIDTNTYTLYSKDFPYVKYFFLKESSVYEGRNIQAYDYETSDRGSQTSDRYLIVNKKVNYGVMPSDTRYEFWKTDYENNSLLHIKVNGKWGIIDQESNILVPVAYDTILMTYDYSVYAGFNNLPLNKHCLGWLCKKDGLYGILSNNDSFNIPFVYTKLSYFEKGYLKAKWNGKYGLLSYDNKVLIPFEIDSFYTNHWKSSSDINGGILLFAINKSNQLAMYCTNGQKTGYDFTSFEYLRNNQGEYICVKLFDGKMYGTAMFTSYGIYYYPCAFKKVNFARRHLGCDYLKVQRANNQYGYINNTGRKFYED